MFIRKLNSIKPLIFLIIFFWLKITLIDEFKKKILQFIDNCENETV